MHPEVVVDFRPNNQITLTLQNVISSKVKIYQHLDENQWLPPDRLAKKKVKEKCRLAWYRWKYPPLDIIQKSQAKKITLRGKEYNDFQTRYISEVWGFSRSLKLVCMGKLRWFAFRVTAHTLFYKSQYQLNRERQFTSGAGQKILESGAIVEMLCGDRPEFAHVTTLTLPANTRDSFECLAACSNFAVNRLFQLFRDKYTDTKNWFFVWEFQKRGALHLHICHYHPDTTEGQWIGTQLIESWHEVLCDISENSGICMFSRRDGKSCTIRGFHQHHTQPMVKGCGRYFAKYAAKSAKTDENSYVREHAKTLSPTRWWGSSRPIKALVKENSLQLRLYAMNGSPEKVFNEIEQEILLREIVSFRETEWKIEVERVESYSMKLDLKSKPIVRQRKTKLIVSEGVRHTFYVSPKDYQALLTLYSARIA